jgi:lipoprotein-anchoring transpeptidase ErfK/SrfK
VASKIKSLLTAGFVTAALAVALNSEAAAAEESHQKNVAVPAGRVASTVSVRNDHSVVSIESRTASEPIIAIVSLRSQQITVYDADGWILRAPISSGQKGRETPAGVFSIIQKEAEHYSNLYDDAFMPHMQRITWSGIALHGGALPGHPASHGCVRLPYDFAEHLFDVTRLGMRVIVAPNDVSPVTIAHPVLFPLKSGTDAAATARTAAADAAEAASKADQARLAVVTAFREAARARVPVRAVENLKLRAEAQLAAAKREADSAGTAEEREQAGDAKAKTAARIAELEVQLAAAKADLQPKLDALAPAREAAVAAETARVAAAEIARLTSRDLEPVSVFISRKTQRLYVRQAFQTVLDIPVTIQDVDRSIGTHVFTAMERTGDDMRWSVVSLNNGYPDLGMAEPHGPTGGGGGGYVDPMSGGAKAALDRIVIPEDTFDRIAGMVSPRSSLIISDEPLSSETGKGTEFVVLMSGEPQGGIKNRRRGPQRSKPVTIVQASARLIGAPRSSTHIPDGKAALPR